MLGACLPNLAALRLGERDDDDGGDEADVGAPTLWDIGRRLSYGPANIFDGQTWMGATANMDFDANAPQSAYVTVMQRVMRFAGEQLDGVKPKYVFLVDGENVWQAFVKARAAREKGHAAPAVSTIERKLDEMFDNVIEIEQRDLEIHARLRGCPEWRQPTALFVFTSKHAKNNPMDMHPFGRQVLSWARSDFSAMMEWAVNRYIEKFGTVSDRVVSHPRAVACQMHIHVQKCTEKSQGPCQDIDTQGPRSLCYNYDSGDQFKNARVPLGQYKHAYCEFDDLVVGRLYEATTQILARWSQRAQEALVAVATRRGLPWPGAPGVTTDPWNEYSSNGWGDVQQTLLDRGLRLPAPTPFMVTKDPGIRYQELHQQQQPRAMLHVNWEWVLFAPRIQELWVGTAYRQEKASNDLNGYRARLERMSREMSIVAAPTPQDVDTSMRRFSGRGLRITVFPGLIVSSVRDEMLYFYSVKPLPPPAGSIPLPRQPLPEAQPAAAAAAQQAAAEAAARAAQQRLEEQRRAVAAERREWN